LAFNPGNEIGAMMTEFKEISQAIIEGDSEKAETLTKQSLDNGVSPLDIFRQGMVPGMGVVGEKMKAGEYYIPEVLMSAEAMKAASVIIKPLIAQQGTDISIGKVVIGTVKGDLHDIGKMLASMMLEGAGYEVIDLGIDVPAETFVRAVRDEKPHIVGMSALLTSTMMAMKDVIAALAQAGLRDSVRIIIGGAPVTQDFCNQIQADGYAPDAARGVELAKSLSTINQS
jgi:5-methyltetrahydrofolate--homocysteine methyltransferase